MGIYLEIILPVTLPPARERERLLRAIQALPACEAFTLSAYQVFIQRRRCRLAHYPEEQRELAALGLRCDPEDPPKIELPDELEAHWQRRWE
ncbi:MAG: hypothetical protein KC910_23225, partial [Candidatus Eremiobacteraeota bacterium]|nr:hypothetical protein [Candidatus Eremiobacteraeota bacterium]